MIDRLSAGYFAGLLFHFLGIQLVNSLTDNMFLKILLFIVIGVALLFVADMFSKPEYKGNKLNGEEVNLNGVSIDVKEEDGKRIVSVTMVHKSDSIKLINFLRTLTSPDNIIITEMEEQNDK